MKAWINIWINLWKARRQKDEVKCIFLLVIVIIYFLFRCISGIINYVQMVGFPAEYVLQKEGHLSLLGVGLKNIQEIDGVVSASLQSEYTITIAGDGSEIALSVVELSEAYLSKCYQIQETGGMKQFYLNTSAYEQLRELIELTGETVDSQSARMTYAEGETSGKMAEFIKVSSLPDDQPAAWCAGTISNLELEDREVSTRVMFDQEDISGSHISALQRLGYTVVNQEDILSYAYEQKLLLQRLKFSLIIIGLSSVCSYLLFKKIQFMNN